MAEEYNPIYSASRQKSCNACVKGKRRCDKRHPVCSRCEEKGVQCIYAKRTYAEAFYDLASADLDFSWAGYPALSSSIDFINEVTSGITPSAYLNSTHVANLDGSINPTLIFTENQDTASSHMQLVGNASELLDQAQNEERLNDFNYTPMADICQEYQPWHVYDPSTKAHFIIETMKGYISTFAKDNYTPWMHKHLYKDQMPSSIRSCFTVSAAYTHMTSNNKSSVFRVLCQSLDELKEQQSARTPQETLARAQALLLYQIIATFDGDVTLRSNADKEMSLLLEWIDQLCKIRENLATPEDMNISNPPRSWEWWIFSESVRRTIVISYTFIGLWSVLCRHSDDRFFVPWKFFHCWTLSRPLWEAASSFDFFQKWKSYPVIRNFDLRNFIRTGTADAVDDFSKFFMVVYMGLDESKQWFKDKGDVF